MTTPDYSKSSLTGVNVLLQGSAGTGKTTSIGSLVELGFQVHYMAFESGTESLLGYWRDTDRPPFLRQSPAPIPSNLHITTVKAASAGWSEFADSVKDVNTLSYEALKKTTDRNRSKYNQLELFLRGFNNVTDDTGVQHGAINTWGTDRVLVIDGLTGLGNASLKAVTGGKVDRDQKDWGLAQNMVENIIRNICDDCRCHFVLLAHEEREPDPLGGVSKITVSTLGRALAPKIPAMFSDVIRTKRIGKEFFWDTEDALCDLKTRNLPITSKMPQDFSRIIKSWMQRGSNL
jgi:AAA domain